MRRSFFPLLDFPWLTVLPATSGRLAISFLRQPPTAGTYVCLFAAALLLGGCGTPTVPRQSAAWPEKAAPAGPTPTPTPTPQWAASVEPPALTRRAVAMAPPRPVVQPTPIPPPPQAVTPRPGAEARVSRPAPIFKAPKLVAPLAPEKAPLKVALLLPLSGVNREIGRALLDAAQLALFDVGDARLELLPKDTGGTPDGAAGAAQRALEEGAELILGPLLSSSVAAAAPAARARGVNMVAFSTDRAVAGDGVYLLSFMPEEQVRRVVGHAVSRGLWRLAALVPDSAYGAVIVQALDRAAEAHGGMVVQVEVYPDQTEASGPALHDAVRRLANYDQRREALLEQQKLLEEIEDEIFAEALKRLEGLETLGEVEFDAVILPEGGERLQKVALLLPYYDVDPTKIRVLGTGQWDDENIGREPALVGGWFAAPEPEAAAAFRQRFLETYGRNPPRIASLAYDAVALAGLLGRDKTPTDEGVFSRAALTATRGFAGTDGIFRFGAGGVVERGLAVIEVRPNRLMVIQPAPRTFEELVN